jgi:hypothetical protein
LTGCAEQSNSFDKLVDSAWQDGWTLPGYLVEDSRDTFFNRNNQILLGLAGGASIAMYQGADENLAV